MKKLEEDIGLLKQNYNSTSEENFNNKNDSIIEIVEIIILKYENGLRVNDELVYLEKLINSNIHQAIIDKLYLLEINKFDGIRNLEILFENSKGGVLGYFGQKLNIPWYIFMTIDLNNKLVVHRRQI